MRPIDADYVLSKIGEYADHPNEELVQNIAIAFDIVCEAPTIKTKQVKYFDEDENVWKIGSVIVDEL